MAYETAGDTKPIGSLELETFATYGRRFRRHLRIADDLTVWLK